MKSICQTSFVFFACLFGWLVFAHWASLEAQMIKNLPGGVALRWWRNRMGRPLSPPQIHPKIIWTLSKFHRTTSESWQRTSGTQKGSPLSLKGDTTKYKDKKRDKRVRNGDPSLGGNHERGEVSKHQETLSPGESGEFWNLRGQHSQEEKINK